MTNSTVSPLPTNALHRPTQPSATPIAQKIDALLLCDLDHQERQYFLWLKCRDEPIILAAEIEAIALIWELHYPQEAA